LPEDQLRRHNGRGTCQEDAQLAGQVLCVNLQLVSKPLSAVIGCKACGSAFSAKRVLNVPQHASEPFSPRALTTGFSLDLATKQVLKPVVVFSHRFSGKNAILRPITSISPIIVLFVGNTVAQGP